MHPYVTVNSKPFAHMPKTNIQKDLIASYVNMEFSGIVRVCLKIILDVRINNACKYQSCTAYTLLIIFKWTRKRFWRRVLWVLGCARAVEHRARADIGADVTVVDCPHLQCSVLSGPIQARTCMRMTINTNDQGQVICHVAGYGLSMHRCVRPIKP